MESQRTSPYLLKPVRSLEEVSAERGETALTNAERDAGERLDNDTFRRVRAGGC